MSFSCLRAFDSWWFQLMETHSTGRFLFEKLNAVKIYRRTDGNWNGKWKQEDGKLNIE